MVTQAEIEYFLGYLWYWYYKTRYSVIGDKIVTTLSRLLPYAKFIAAIAGLAGTAATVVFAASPPGWALMAISAATALGVVLVPNREVDAVLKDGMAAVRAGEAALGDVRAGDLPAAGTDITTAMQAVEGGVADAEKLYRDFRSGA